MGKNIHITATLGVISDSTQPPPPQHVDRAWVQAEATGSFKKAEMGPTGERLFGCMPVGKKKEGNREMEMDGDKLPGLFFLGGFQKLQNSK